MKRKIIYIFVLFLSIEVFGSVNVVPAHIASNLEIQNTWDYYLTTTDNYPTVKIMDFYDKKEKSSYLQEVVPQDSRRRIYVPYSNGCFVVRRDTDRIYKFNDQPFSPHTNELITVHYYDFHEQRRIYPVGSYFNINETPVKYKISVTDDRVTERDVGKYKKYTFHEKGTIHFNIDLGEIKASISIEVIELPFGSDSSVDTMVETIGFPVKQKSDGVSWPNSRYLYGFYYSPRAGHSVFKTFYFYSQFPYLVLSSYNDRIDGVAYERIDD